MIDFRSIWRLTGRCDEKRPTLTKHCACAVRRASDLPEIDRKSLGNRCGSLLRNALRKGRLKKWSRGLPRASWGRFGRLRDTPEATRASSEIPLDASRERPGSSLVTPKRPGASPERLLVNFASILVQFGVDLSRVFAVFWHTRWLTERAAPCEEAPAASSIFNPKLQFETPRLFISGGNIGGQRSAIPYKAFSRVGSPASAGGWVLIL